MSKTFTMEEVRRKVRDIRRKEGREDAERKRLRIKNGRGVYDIEQRENVMRYVCDLLLRDLKEGK